MQDAQDDRSQICLNYVTKGPNVIAKISRTFYCCFLYIVCTIYMFLKSKNRSIKLKIPFSFQTTINTLSPPQTHFWIQVYIIANINTGLHHASPTQTFLSKYEYNNLTGSSEFTLKSLLPVNWQQPFHRKIAAAS